MSKVALTIASEQMASDELEEILLAVQPALEMMAALTIHIDIIEE